MKRISFDVSGCNFEFICTSRSTRNGFAHDATMFINDREDATGHAYWINRTWEYWTYQIACLDAVCKAYEQRNNQYLQYFKEHYGYKKLTAKRKAEFDEYKKQFGVFRKLEEAKQHLKAHDY